MINFGSAFVTKEANDYSAARNASLSAFRDARPDMPADVAERMHNGRFVADHGPYPYATLDDVLDHIDHVVGLVGVDHVGIGSDYDGVGDSLPVGLKDVSSYPNLVRGLRNRGYGDADLAKILGGNLLRVWSSVERAATRRDAGQGGPLRKPAERAYAAATTSSST
jgi:membrane dipeptidase